MNVPMYLYNFHLGPHFVPLVFQLIFPYYDTLLMNSLGINYGEIEMNTFKFLDLKTFISFEINSYEQKYLKVFAFINIMCNTIKV